MILTSDFKTGMTILYEGNIYQIIEFLQSNQEKVKHLCAPNYATCELEL